MDKTEAQYCIINYNFDYLNAISGRFVMDSQTNMKIANETSSRFCLEFNWFRKILRTDTNKIVTHLNSLSSIRINNIIDYHLIDYIFTVLEEHEKNNLDFIKKNTFKAFEMFPNVYYSSFLDEEIMPLRKRKKDMEIWLKEKILELNSENLDQKT